MSKVRVSLERLRELNAKGFTLQEADRQTTDKPPAAVPESAYEMEGDLAAACVMLFRSLGLRARSDFDITAPGTCNGWYFHIKQAKGNPYVLDYIIMWHKTGRYAEIEIKSRSGAIRPIQKRILEHGGNTYLCRTIDEVKRALTDAWTVKRAEAET